MSDGIFSALTGALAQVRRLDVLSNNLANVETTGFKADRLTFEETLSDIQRMEATIQAPGAGLPPRLLPDDKQFVETMIPVTSLLQGPLRETGNHLDVALVGDGYLAIETADGVRYTRDGSLRADEEGRLVTASGDAVLAAGGGDITLHPGEVTIATDGTVYVGREDVGQLEIVRLDGPPTKVGRSQFAGNAIPADPDIVEVRQGYLEGSNVNPVQTMTDLISVHRTFEVLQSLISEFRSMDGRAANEVGRTKTS